MDNNFTNTENDFNDQTTTVTYSESEKPKNFFAGYKDFSSLKTGDKILHILLPVIIVVVAAVILFSVFSTDYVSFVKDGTLNDYPDEKTVGEAFDDFFAEPSWESFEAENGKTIVEFKGTCEYYDEDAECVIQFEIDEDDETFETYAVEIDGKPLNLIEIALLYESIYSE